ELRKRIGHVAVLQDIDEQKRAEKALRETRTVLAALVEHYPGAVFVEDPEGRYFLTNSAAVGILGQDIVAQDDYVVQKMPLWDEKGELLGRITLCREVANGRG